MNKIKIGQFELNNIFTIFMQRQKSFLRRKHIKFGLNSTVPLNENCLIYLEWCQTTLYPHETRAETRYRKISKCFTIGIEKLVRVSTRCLTLNNQRHR